MALTNTLINGGVFVWSTTVAPQENDEVHTSITWLDRMGSFTRK